MKKRQVVLCVVLMLMLLCTSVYATISGSINLKASKTDSLTAGEEFTVTLSLDNISSTKGITSINGYININKDILEDLTVNSIVTNSNGKVEINSNNILPVYDAASTEASNADTGITFNTNPTSGNGDYRLVIDLANAINSGTDLVTIKFKVKSGVTEGTYKDAISYTLFKIYSGTEEKADVVSKALDITVGTANSGDNDDSKDDVFYDFTVTNIDGKTTTVKFPSGKTLIDIFKTYQNSNVSSITLEWANSGEVPEASNFDIDNIVTSLKNTASTIIVRGYDSNKNNVITGTYTLKNGVYSLVLSTKSTAGTDNSNNNGNNSNNGNNANNNQNKNNTANNVNKNNTANNSNNQGSSSTNNSVDNTTATGTLPYTGYKFIVLPIAVIAIAGFIFYKKYDKYNKF